jgi:hypothetical protein
MVFLRQGVLSASTLLLNHVSSALMQYASHGHSMRRQLKAIRTRIENLDDLKRQRRTTCQKVEEAETQLENMDPEHRNFSSRTEALNGFRQAVREMNSTIKLEEAALADFKRTSTKMWMGLKFGGLVECCEKGAVRIFPPPPPLLPFHFPPYLLHLQLDCGEIRKIGHCCE